MTTDKELTDRDYILTSVTGDVTVIARKLRDMADHAERQAAAFRSGKGDPVTVAADIVNELTQAYGNLGTHLWSLLKDAQDLTRASS